jgi:Ca2+-binding RTX toxin-like protein
MASVQVLTNDGFDARGVLIETLANGVVESFSEDEIVFFDEETGIRITLGGTGFARDEDGTFTAGNVGEVTWELSDTVLATGEFFSLDAATLWAAAAAAAGGDDGPFQALLDTNTYGFQGGAGDDRIDGGNGGDFLVGAAGDDTITGRGGFDVLDYTGDGGGGSGVVVDLAAGTATDTHGDTDTLSGIEAVRGSFLADRILGADGKNSFTGFGGADVLDGRGGFDTADYSQEDGAAGIAADLVTRRVVDTYGDTDKLKSIEAVRGSAIADEILGSDVDDQFEGLAGDDVIDGRGGVDLVRYDRELGAVQGVDVDLTAGIAIDGFGDTDELAAIESVRGGALGDRLRGDADDNRFEGGGGDDRLNGLDGFDSLLGEAGRDVLNGGKGVDLLDGGERADQLTGGKGGDTFRFLDDSGRDRILDLGATDVVDLTRHSGVDGFDDIKQRTDADGNAVANLGGGDSITFVGLTWAEIEESAFLF